MPTLGDLQQLRALPLKAKIALSLRRINEFYDAMEGKVFIAFSGGKDSTVLLDLVRKYYPDVPAVFVNTGLEYPEVQKFCRDKGAVILKPSLSFVDVMTNYGYPVVSKEVSEAIFYARRIINNNGKYKLNRTVLAKRRELLGKRIYVNKKEVVIEKSKYNKVRWLPLAQETDFPISNRCCFFMKKSSIGKYQRKDGIYPYVGTLAEESILRQASWLRIGCNSYDKMYGASRPLSFWTEHDILEYIDKNNLDYCSVYGDLTIRDGEYCFTGQNRTGCIFCGFGMFHSLNFDKFIMLSKTHPRQYEYCMEGGQYIPNPDYDPKAPEMDEDWKNWNPEKIWVPSKEGLGMRHVLDQMIKLYGDKYIHY